MSLVASLLVILACLFLSAFFSSSETALLRLHSHDVERDVKSAEGPEPFAIRSLLRSTSHLLVTILLGNNVVNTLGVAVASTIAVAALGEQLGVVVATAVMTVLLLVFCEILPKAAAAAHAPTFARAVALPLYVIHFLLRPLHFVFDRLVEPMIRALGDPAEPAPLSAEQILRIARHMPTGDQDTNPAAIMGAAVGAAETTVSDIMVPRTEMSAYPVTTTPAALLEEMLEERYTRVPVYEETIDEILGVVHLKDLIKHIRTGGTTLQDIVRSVLRVPTRKPILRLLADMQRAFCHLAIVKDEFGVTQGMVTQEDILEELVGEIRDEFDREELLTVRKTADGGYRALARVSVRDFNRISGWEIPGERGETLGGVVFNALGHSPRMGEVVMVDTYRIEIIDVSGNRITEVKIDQLAEGDVAEDAATEGEQP